MDANVNHFTLAPVASLASFAFYEKARFPFMNMRENCQILLAESEENVDVFRLTSSGVRRDDKHIKTMQNI